MTPDPTIKERCRSKFSYGTLGIKTDAIKDQQEVEKEEEGEQVVDRNDVSYWDLLNQNRQFRLLLLGYLATICGEWLTYIASIDFIEEKRSTKHGVPSKTAISVLVLIRLMPNVLLSSVGGVMADALDRRHLMVMLEIAGALSSLLFVLAYNIESTTLIYVATFIQECIAGLYQPSASSIVPLVVKDDNELIKATTLLGLAYSGMTAFGAAASGIIVDSLGIRACFLIDGLTYAVSALLLFQIHGDYKVSSSDTSTESIWGQFKSMVVDGTKYLYSSYFGALVFMKACAAITYGATDILNVAFSEQENTTATSKNMKLGILFAVIGIGALVGPLTAEPFIDAKFPAAMQFSCVVAFAVSTFGYFGWSFETPFWSICTFALIQSAGSAVVWINSTVLLQQFSSHDMMGRVLAADYALGLLTEALSAYFSGAMMDNVGLTANQVSAVLAWTALTMTLLWAAYHFLGYGAGQYETNNMEVVNIQQGKLNGMQSSEQELLLKV